jgi:hypothetical protein
MCGASGALPSPIAPSLRGRYRSEQGSHRRQADVLRAIQAGGRGTSLPMHVSLVGQRVTDFAFSYLRTG